MQTFLPHETFLESAAVLDAKRLGKQRVEALQILNAIDNPDYGWQHHPATNMWRGYREALIVYGICVCCEWISRGYKDSILSTLSLRSDPSSPVVYPPWLGHDDFHRSHQSNLIRKDAAHYGSHFPGVPDNLPYLWPTSGGTYES